MSLREKDLSPTAKKFLVEQGCSDVYGEVLDIDLVGKNKGLLIGVELKTRLNITVLAQAAERLKHVNYSYVGIPRKGFRHYRALSPVYRLFIEHHGLGILLLDPVKTREWSNDETDIHYHYEIARMPKINRKPKYKESILPQLNDFTKDRTGGQVSGEVYTPYKFMFDEVYNYLKSVRDYWGDGWKTLDEILVVCRRVSNHYSSPRGSLYQLLNRNISTFEKHDTEHKYRYRIRD